MDSNLENNDWAAYVDAMCKVQGLNLDPARREEVIVQLRRIHVLAQRFLEFPLPVEVEPATIFRP